MEQLTMTFHFFNLIIFISLIFYIIEHFFQLVGASTPSPMNGVDLKLVLTELVGMIELKRNSNGTIYELNGVLPKVIDWLSKKYNFSYGYLQTLAPHTEDSPKGRGALSFIQSGEADIYLGGAVASSFRFKSVDFTLPWTETTMNFLIPYPTSMENIAAIVKPFDFKIWLLLLFSFPVMMATLYGLNRAIERLNKKLKSRIEQNGFDTIRGTVDYVTNVFFSHGGWCSSKKLTIRLAAGAWCLACFVIVTAYSSVLISFIVSPNLKPIIESIRDIPKVPGLQVVAIKGATIERVFSVAPVGSSYRIVADQWRANPSLLYNTSDQCVEEVRKGNRVFPESIITVTSLMNKDHKVNGKCTLTIAKIPFAYSKIAFPLRKNSPFTDVISQGVLELRQFGLIQHWEKQFLPQPNDCLTNYQDIPKQPRISLKNLSGAFLILLVGLTASFFAFIVERIVYYHQQNV